MTGQVIFHALTTDEDISPLVGDRVYPNRPPQSVLKPDGPVGTFILYKTQSSSTAKTQDGSSHVKEVLYLAIVGSDQDEVFKVSYLISKKLHFYEGTVEETTIDFMTLEEQEDDYYSEAELPMRGLTFNVLSTISKN